MVLKQQFMAKQKPACVIGTEMGIACCGEKLKYEHPVVDLVLGPGVLVRCNDVSVTHGFEDRCRRVG